MSKCVSPWFSGTLIETQIAQGSPCFVWIVCVRWQNLGAGVVGRGGYTGLKEEGFGSVAKCPHLIITPTITTLMDIQGIRELITSPQSGSCSCHGTQEQIRWTGRKAGRLSWFLFWKWGMRDVSAHRKNFFYKATAQCMMCNDSAAASGVSQPTSRGEVVGV